jgi:hypothetical protein
MESFSYGGSDVPYGSWKYEPPVGKIERMVNQQESPTRMQTIQSITQDNDIIKPALYGPAIDGFQSFRSFRSLEENEIIVLAFVLLVITMMAYLYVRVQHLENLIIMLLADRLDKK